LKVKSRKASRQNRHRRVRKRVVGTDTKPRLAVFRSNRHIYAQLIDDMGGRTIAAASTLQDAAGDGSPRDRAKAVGQAVAKKAASAGIKSVVFDRGGFMFHGRVQAVADGAREGGLEL
jgi:large subunit ribosomal protein L18